MPENRPIQIPAGFAPATAVGFADANGDMVLITTDNPLPTATAPAAAPTALEGQASTSSVVGPYTPNSLSPIVIQLDGVWEGTVQLLRSVDNGASKQPVTLAGEVWGKFSANALEPIWQETEIGAELYLDIEISSGSLAYRVSQ